MLIYLDDVRPIPNGYVGCRTADEAIMHLSTGKVTFISFDHDLGTELTGYDVAVYIEESVQKALIPLPAWKVHSANPVGRKRIEQAMLSAEKVENTWGLNRFA